MRNQIRARRAAATRRQRLQIGGGSLLVAGIWSVALFWPGSGGDEPASHRVPVPRASYSAWDRPFDGTTSAGNTATSIPTVVPSTVSTAEPTSPVGAPPPAPETTAPPVTSGPSTGSPSPSPSPTSERTKKGNGTGKPSKPAPPTPSPSTSEGFDLLDLFGL